MNLETVYVIGGFVAMVLAPVLAAQLIGSRSKRPVKHDSGATPSVRVTDPVPPGVSHHLRPKPRRRGLR